MKHLFGPVPSRRLGRSLGIDLVPYKVCSFDCIYCQLGRTTEKTIKRKTYVNAEEILRELEDKLRTDEGIDYLTLSGSGEPTLCSETGRIIKEIKNITDLPVAVLTNGSLLWREEVCAGIEEADLIIPSLDAGDEASFQIVNRPCKELRFDKVVDGLIQFSKKNPGKIRLEIFLLDGITSSVSEVEKISKIAERINPSKIQLNTVKRPPAESSALPIPELKMKELSECFTLPTEIIADYKSPVNDNFFSAGKNDIISLLERRPCSLNDISDGLGLHKNEILKYTEELVKQGLITTNTQNGILFYSKMK